MRRKKSSLFYNSVILIAQPAVCCDCEIISVGGMEFCSLQVKTSENTRRRRLFGDVWGGGGLYNYSFALCGCVCVFFLIFPYPRP